MLNKKRWLIRGLVIGLVAGCGLLMFALNGAPKVPPVTRGDSAVESRPFVIKIHARWCPVCMLTKGSWAKLQRSYADRVNLLVFDLTTKASTRESRAEASRLGLEHFFEEHSGDVGSVYILDGSSNEVRASIRGVAKLADYTAAIDENLGQVPVVTGRRD